MLLSPYHYNVFRQEMRTGKIKIIAFQGETDFAGGEALRGAGRKRAEKEKNKARGVIGSSRRDCVIQLLFSSWDKEPVPGPIGH